MFSSFSNVPPIDTHTVWYTSRHFPSHNNEPLGAMSGQTPAAVLDQRHKNRAHDGRALGRISSLQLLQAEEAELRKRKANVARFGAAWIRPPGVPKTLQATMDEMAERAEQEALAQREAAAAEQQAAFEAQEEEEAEARRQEMMQAQARFGADGQTAATFGEADPEALGERDLDDDVPDADDAGFGLSEDDDERDDEIDLDATDEDDDDNMMEEHDLDDDVPEAGSYQHTDTDVEDESTDAAFPSSSPMRAAQPPSSAALISETRAAADAQGLTVIQDFSQRSLARLPVPRFDVDDEDEDSFQGGRGSPELVEGAESSMLVSSPGVPGARQVRGVLRNPQHGSTAMAPPPPPPNWGMRQPERGS